MTLPDPVARGPLDGAQLEASFAALQQGLLTPWERIRELDDQPHERFGTKRRGRALFAELGVPHPAGREGLAGADDLVQALVEMRAQSPGLAEVVVKLDESVSGEGNARLVLHVVSAVTEHGRPGQTAVGDSPEEAGQLHDRACEGLIHHARRLAGRESAT